MSSPTGMRTDSVRVASPTASMRPFSVASRTPTGVSALFASQVMSASPASVCTAADVVAHIDHAVNVCGEDHVGIGTDGGTTGIDDMALYRAHMRAEVAQRRAAGIGAAGENPDTLPFCEELSGPGQFHRLPTTLLHGLVHQDVSRGADLLAEQRDGLCPLGVEEHVLGGTRLRVVEVDRPEPRLNFGHGGPS